MKDEKEIVEDEAVEESTPAEIDAAAFGPMDEIETTATGLTVRVLCWNLSQSGALGGRMLVNIEDDNEASELLRNEGMVPRLETDGRWTVSMGFKSGEELTLAIQIFDRDLRLLAARALNVKYLRQDPPVGPLLARFAMMMQTEKARLEKEAAAQH